MQNPTRLDIISLINNSPITTISKDYQTKLLTKIQETFTDSQQQLFVASFYCYLHHNSKNHFVISLDDVWKWCGFARIDPAKVVLVKNFTLDTDYKIVFQQPLENLKGGRPKEHITMTINTFKKFCLKANTKKADEIHEYYIKLEELLQETMNEEAQELKNQLTLKTEELTLKEKELSKEKSLRNQILNRRCYDVESGDYVYVFRDNVNDPNSLIKIGKTTNLKKREEVYSNINKTGNIIYWQKCKNCDIIERAVHHLLDSYRINKMQEFFNCSVELAKTTIKETILFLDKNVVLEENNQIIEQENENNLIEENVEEILDEQIDFDKFISECCNVNKDSFVATEDLKCAFRIWSKATDKPTKDLFEEYMLQNFKKSTKLDKDQKRNVYIGLSLVELTFTPSEANLDYEMFISEKCETGWLNRITYTDFFDAFIKYKCEGEGGDYKLSHKYKMKIQKDLEKRFCGGRVYTSLATKTKHLFGILGLSLKGTTGLKTVRNRTTKKVSQYDNSTKNLVKTWNSLSEASRELNIPVSSLSNYTRFENVQNGFYYKYT